jgi:two-component system, response regulator YesN
VTIPVLIVDDEEWVREVVRLSVAWGEVGCRLPRLFDSGREALEEARRLRPAVILLDIQMPGMTGLDFLEYHRRAFPDSKVIVVSGYSQFEYAQRALRCGAYDYLLKPIDEEHLTRVVERAVEEIGTTLADRRQQRSTESALQRMKTTRIVENGIDIGSGDACDDRPEQPRREPDTDGITDQRVVQAVDAVRRSLAAPPTLPEVAAAVGLSPSYFSELFSAQTGRSYAHTIMLERISHAQRLLRDTWMRIGEVGELVGYPNSNYFSKVFRRRTGLLPSEYRRHHRGENPNNLP